MHEMFAALVLFTFLIISVLIWSAASPSNFSVSNRSVSEFDFLEPKYQFNGVLI